MVSPELWTVTRWPRAFWGLRAKRLLPGAVASEGNRATVIVHLS